MASLIGYLRHLSHGPVPGATGDTLEFATIVTPDADPIERQGMLDVLTRYFDSKNGFLPRQGPPDPDPTPDHVPRGAEVELACGGS